MLSKIRNSYKGLSLLVMCTVSVGMLGLLRWQAYDVDAMDVSGRLAFNENTVQTYTYMEKVEPPCVRIDDDELYVGEELVYQEEKTGLREVTVMVTYNRGEETKREVLDQEIIEAPVAKEIHVGTKEKPRYILPVDNYVFTSGFGARWGTTHCGVDLAVPSGTEVKAAADGNIIQSGWNGGYGISVYIQHDDGSVTRYGHMSETLVAVGDRISQGDVIGLSGNTGDSTGPHVHFEIRIDGQAVDPCDYFDEGI